jgi:hypothetical protein
VKQIAQLSAADGRVVTVLTHGNPNVMRAQQMTWDMANDVLTVIRGAGTANR